MVFAGLATGTSLLSPGSSRRHVFRGGRTGGSRLLSSTGGSDALSSPSDPSKDPEKDYLYQLGRSDLNLNIDTGQNAMHLDSLFVGDFLGTKSDIADGSLRTYEFRSFENIVGDFYVAPRFMERIAMHVVKNYMSENFVSKLRIPLILGIWGPKGTGKSFQTELTFKKMGLEPIIMSAGELEHEWAGTPGKLIRERYKRAAEVSRVHGKLTCLLINDIDAGIGRFANTQVTVNNQIVVGTLMNICDNPNRVSVGESWQEDSILRRIPIVVTGNDFSRLFAPLLRDGRMEKFYWDPNDQEVVEIVYQMYKDDDLTEDDIRVLKDTFPNQPLDFFGAIRAATYDNQIRNWIATTIGASTTHFSNWEVMSVGGEDFTKDEVDMKDLGSRLVHKRDLPNFEPVQLTLEMLIREGNRLATEQQRVNDLRLAKEYMRDTRSDGTSLIGFSG